MAFIIAHCCFSQGLKLDFFSIHFQLVDSFLRLLINTRDELSLANVVAGFVSHEDFSVIKKEAKKTKMPLYQVGHSYE